MHGVGVHQGLVWKSWLNVTSLHAASLACSRIWDPWFKVSKIDWEKMKVQNYECRIFIVLQKLEIFIVLRKLKIFIYMINKISQTSSPSRLSAFSFNWRRDDSTLATRYWQECCSRSLNWTNSITCKVITSHNIQRFATSLQSEPRRCMANQEIIWIDPYTLQNRWIFCFFQEIRKSMKHQLVSTELCSS